MKNKKLSLQFAPSYKVRSFQGTKKKPRRLKTRKSEEHEGRASLPVAKLSNSSATDLLVNRKIQTNNYNEGNPKMVTTNKRTLKYNRMAAQAGMTLIELTVVLLVLVGLAGILVPYVGSFNQTTHDSTNSSNLAATNDAVNRYISEKNKLPPHMDLLTNAAAATAAATGSCASAAVDKLYCGLANSVDGAASGSAGVLTTTSYTAGTDDIAIQSLVDSGINMAVANNPDIDNKTFGTSTGMYMLNTPTAGGWASAKFAAVGAGGFSNVTAMGSTTTAQQYHLAAALGRDPMVYKTACYDYLAFGLGDNNELVQSTATAAPVYYPQDANFGPAQRYAHLLAIVQVDKSNDTAAKCSEKTEKAKFLGVVANVPTSESATLVGVNSLLKATYDNKAKQGS